MFGMKKSGLKRWWLKFLKWLVEEDLQRPSLDEVIPIPPPRRVMVMLRGASRGAGPEFLSHPSLWPDGANAVCRPMADGRSQFVWVNNVALACEFKDEPTALVFVNALLPDLKEHIFIVSAPVKSFLEKVNGNNSYN